MNKGTRAQTEAQKAQRIHEAEREVLSLAESYYIVHTKRRRGHLNVPSGILEEERRLQDLTKAIGRWIEGKKT